MTVQNTHRSYVGIAKETTKGTAVAATDFIPVIANTLKPVDVIDPLYDTGLRGSLVEHYGYIPGRTRSTIAWSGDVFPDTIGYAIAGVLGSTATTGATAPYSHTISLKNASAVAADAQPTSFTITDFYAANVRQYAGVQFHDFNLKFNADGLLQYDASGTGWASAATTAPTPSFSTVLPTPVWAGTVTIGGTTISNAVTGNLAMKRNANHVYGIQATQNPYQIFVGALGVTGKVTFLMEQDTELTRYLTNTQPTIVFNWTQGTGATLTQVQFTLTKGAYIAAANERGDDMVKITVDIDAQANTTDAGSTGGYGPVKWVLQNAKPAGTYQ